VSAVRLLLPELVLLAGAVVALFAELVPGLKRSPAGFGAIVAAVAAALAAAVPSGTTALFGGMLLVDPTSTFVRVAIASLTAAFLLWVAGRGMGGERSREAVALALFAALGGMLMASANDLVTLFIAIELGTMPAYVLIGYGRTRESSLEGTLKYYLLSLLTSLFMLYGLALLYALSGSTGYGALNLSRAGSVGVLAALFVAVGFLAKMSAAPFHYWAPDAYAGAPAASVAFVSSVPKIAGVAAMARLLTVLVAQTPGLAAALAVAAAVSMVLGNLAAYPQADIRRMMAYSGVAHVGYMLVALSTGTSLGASAAVFYVVAYAVPSMAIMLVAAEEGSNLDEIAGLGSRHPWKAWSMLVFLLSLVGIPPMAGFIGKLYLFTAAWSGGQGLLVLLAVLMSVVSLGYYFRVVRAMFGKPVAPGQDVPRSAPAAIAIAGLVVATLAIGIAAAPLLGALGVSLP
jgi:NADH-quinone oxidoreductase subunit N